MKTKIFLFCLLSSLLITHKIFPQGETAVPFLIFPISPSQNAMGYTGASLPIDDPYGFLLNPAQLGNSSIHNNISYIFYPSKVSLWDVNGLTVTGNALNVGYNFNRQTGIPITLGLGYATQKFENSTDFLIDLSSTGFDKYEAFSFGIGVDYYVKLNIGATYKNIYSTLPIYFDVNLPNVISMKTSTWDFGVLLNVPLLKLIDNELSINVINKKPLKPFFDISFGYSQLNIGNEIYYVDPAQSDPLPRTARLGYGISTGVNISIDDSPLRFLGFDFTVDAEDLLLGYEYISEGSFNYKKFSGYQSFIGDINIGKNILQIKGDDNVTVHAGGQFNILESLILKFGHITGVWSNNRTTNGFEIRSEGLLIFLSSVTNNSIVKFLSNHFDLRYYNSNYIAAEDFETNMKGISIYIKNLDSIF